MNAVSLTPKGAGGNTLCGKGTGMSHYGSAPKWTQMGLSSNPGSASSSWDIRQVAKPLDSQAPHL